MSMFAGLQQAMRAPAPAPMLSPWPQQQMQQSPQQPYLPAPPMMIRRPGQSRPHKKTRMNPAGVCVLVFLAMAVVATVIWMIVHFTSSNKSSKANPPAAAPANGRAQRLASFEPASVESIFGHTSAQSREFERTIYAPDRTT